MHNYDDVRAEKRKNADRKFTVLGKVFTFREYLPRNVLDPLIEVSGGSDAEWFVVADKLMVETLLEPGHEKEWQEVVDEKERPLSIYELRELIFYVIEIAAGHPTEPSSVSSTTPRARGTSSTEKSPSPVAT